ncbi:hypothetical protein OROGR_016298 [Orobanche gracilis]
MASDTDSTDPLINLEGGYGKDDTEVSVRKDETTLNSDESKQMLNGRPPRHLSAVRHSISNTTLVSASELLKTTCPKLERILNKCARTYDIRSK